MIITGNKWIPVIFLTFILAFATLFAEEIIVYSLPQEKVNSELQEKFTRETSLRQWISLNGVWRLKHPKTGETMGQLRLPCTFQAEGALIFEKKFNLEREPGHSYELHLGAINGDFKIRLNDSLLYRDTQNYFPVSVSLPFDILHGGENTLEIELRRENFRLEDLPAFLPINIPKIDTGVLNWVYIEIKPSLHIASIRAIPNVSDSLIQLQGSVSFNRPIPAAAKFHIQVAYVSSEKIIFKKDIPLTTQPLPEFPLPEWPPAETANWSPDNQFRYWVEVTLDSAGQVLDRMQLPLAIRSVKKVRETFTFNDRPFNVRGINYVYQNTEGSDLFDPQLVRRDLEDIKERGFNAVRVILHPMPERFYQLCDEVGLLCFQDLPFVFIPTGDVTSRRNTVQRWQDSYEYMVSLSRRYSAIAALGVAFYIDGDSPLHRQRLKSLVSHIATPRQIPVYASTMIPAEEIFEAVDFQIIDIIERHPPEVEFQRIYNAFERHLFFPSAYSKAFSYRIDTTTVTSDLQQINHFYERFTRNKLPGEIEGHFIPTYNDFYLQLPSVQNGSGGERNFSYNRVGLVDIKRQPRSFSRTSPEEDLLTPPEIGLIYEEKATHSFLYILIGFLNVVLFLISYKRYRVFRQNLSYSIRKPHGFFVNLQERISIPYKQSFFLLLVMSINGAIVLSSVVYFYRNTLIFDYLLSLVFFQPWLKQIVSEVVWDQALFLIVGTVGIIFGFYLLAFIIKIFSFFGEARVLFNQALAAAIWSAAPFVLLLPLGIFMYNILLLMKYYWILFGVLLYFYVWVYFRWINGVRVLTDRLYYRVFLLFTLLILVGGSAIAYFYNQNYNALEHLQFIYHLYAFTN